jgi:hypothetical protein
MTKKVMTKKRLLTVRRSAPSSLIARQGEPYCPANCAAIASSSAASSSAMRGSPSFLMTQQQQQQRQRRRRRRQQVS